MCGEKIATMALAPCKLGSPPRVRGKVGLICPTRILMRITPACAGKRTKTFCCRRRCWDHPRVCGEKASATPLKSSPRGSPPRVRGKVGVTPRSMPDKRITPACAGKSMTGMQTCRCTRDHPRVCGEKHDSVNPSISCKGSPPRVRGKAARLPATSTVSRITPACAGKRGRISSLA